MTRDLPAVRNLIRGPRLGRVRTTARVVDPEGIFELGGVLLPRGAKWKREPKPTRWLAVESTPEVPVTWVCPGGGRGAFRSGLTPGGTYTASVQMRIPRRLAGGAALNRLHLSAWCMIDGERQLVARSHRSPNEQGTYRLFVSFRVPSEATAAWVAVSCGRWEGDRVLVTNASLTPTTALVPYFDGGTEGDRWYDYAWTGEPLSSESLRTMRAPRESFPAGTEYWEICDEVVRRLRLFLTEEAGLLADHLVEVVGATSADATIRLLTEESKSLESLALDDPDLRGEASETIRAEVTSRLAQLAESATDAAGPWVRTLAGERTLASDLIADHPAIPLLSAAVGQDGAPPRAGYLLARALERRDPDGSAALARRSAGQDNEVSFIARAAQVDPTHLYGRRTLGLFVAERMPVIRARAEAALEIVSPELGDAPIFTHWGQGFHVAPPVVRACRETLLRHHPAERIHFLDDETVRYYSELPDRVLSGMEGRKAHYAGSLKIDLLTRYGGYWVDSTCYLTQPVTESMPLRTDVTGFDLSSGRWASWFMGSRPGAYVLRMLRAAAWTWWDERQDLATYLMLPGLFEALYYLDEDFRGEWDAAKPSSSDPPHQLQWAMLAPGSETELDRLLAVSGIHKLKFKYDADDVPIDSALARLLRQTPPRP